MMQVRCHKCGWNFTLSRDAIANIMEEVNETKAKHYTMECPKCRQAIKVQTRMLKRYYRPPTAEPADEGTE